MATKRIDQFDEIGTLSQNDKLIAWNTDSSSVKNCSIKDIVNYSLNYKRTKRLIFLGDSLSTGCSRRVGAFDGITCSYGYAGDITNVGSGYYLPIIHIDKYNASAENYGKLEVNGSGSLRWTYRISTSPDVYDTAGAWTDVREGGFYTLSSGTSSYPKIVLAVSKSRGYPTSAGEAVINTSGVAGIFHESFISFTTPIKGALDDIFKDYQNWSFSGAKSIDVLAFLPQAFAQDVEAAVIQIGTNDTDGFANRLSRLQQIIDYAAARARRVYVVSLFPRFDGALSVNQDITRHNIALFEYCSSIDNVRFINSYEELIDKNASALSALSGCYHTDNLHLKARGAVRAAAPIIAAILEDYRRRPLNRFVSEIYDSTTGVGSWNSNPNLRGVGGTVVASKDITGYAPDSWTLDRETGDGALTTSFVSDDDGGIDWFNMFLTGNATSGYHLLKQSTVTLPSGVSVGDYVRLVAELKVGACTGSGLQSVQICLIGNSTNQNIYLMEQLDSSRTIILDGSDCPSMVFRSEPLQINASTTSFYIRVRAGAAVSSTANLMLRCLKMEKCSGPIYP